MPEPPRVRIRQVYEAGPTDPTEIRVLVDRVWPRGVSRESLALDRWAKEIAPSSELRRWFAHDSLKWPQFQLRYRAELYSKLPELRELALLARSGRLLLLYGAHDKEHNQAVVLKHVLEEAV
ncbi:MAG: DUF488 domain-containing protein [Candidatus Dormibacteraceae bacterium]